MSKKHPAVTITMIDRYLTHLREQERSAATLQKYRHDLNELCGYLHNAPLNKSALIDWKELLISKYAPATVNSMLIAVNGYLRFYGWQGLSVKLLKVQKALFIDESKELTKAEYDRLVQEAQRKNNERLALVIQTICATGIRVSELRFITVGSRSAAKANGVWCSCRTNCVSFFGTMCENKKRPPGWYSPPGRVGR